MNSFIRLPTRRIGCDRAEMCDEFVGKKLRWVHRVLIPLSLRVRRAKSQRDREICVWHHGSHINVVNVEIDLPLSVGVPVPSLEVSLSGGNRVATIPRLQSQGMATIVKGRVAEDSNGHDRDN